EYCRRAGITAGDCVGSDLAAAIRAPAELLPPCNGFPRGSFARRQRRDSSQFTGRRLEFPARALCCSSLQRGKGWPSGGEPEADSRRRSRGSKRLDCATRMGETGGDSEFCGSSTHLSRQTVGGYRRLQPAYFRSKAI